MFPTEPRRVWDLQGILPTSGVRVLSSEYPDECSVVKFWDFVQVKSRYPNDVVNSCPVVLSQHMEETWLMALRSFAFLTQTWRCDSCIFCHALPLAVEHVSWSVSTFRWQVSCPVDIPASDWPGHAFSEDSQLAQWTGWNLPCLMRRSFSLSPACAGAPECGRLAVLVSFAFIPAMDTGPQYTSLHVPKVDCLRLRSYFSMSFS